MKCFSICDADDALRYSDKAKLALSLDKADFILDGYPVDDRKHPIKPTRKGKERVRVEEEEEEETEEEEEEGQEAPLSGNVDADVANDKPAGPLRTCGLNPDGSGSSGPLSQCGAQASEDCQTISSESDETTDDDERQAACAAPSPPLKRRKFNAVSASPAESTSPPTTHHDMERTVEILRKKLVDQERTYARLQQEQESNKEQAEKLRVEREEREEKRRQEMQEQLLERQRVVLEASMEAKQAALINSIFARFGHMMPPSQPVASIPTGSVFMTTPSAIAAPPEAVPSSSAVVEMAVEAPSARAASPDRLPSPMRTTPHQSPAQPAPSPSSPLPPVDDPAEASNDFMVISPDSVDRVFSTPAELPAESGLDAAPSAVRATPEYSSGGSHTEE